MKPPAPAPSRYFGGSGRGGRRGLAAMVLLMLAACRTLPPSPEKPVVGPAETPPTAVASDEIVVAGQRFHTGTRVVLWSEPGGYDGYAGQPKRERRQASILTKRQNARIDRDGWDLPLLRKVVDQFVLHYDVCGVSKVCFEVLHKRQLGVHFLLDIDGTIYQTLDLQECAPHATSSNDRAIGVEIANIGAYPPDKAQPLADWYRREPDGSTRITIPARIKNPGVRTPGFVGRPMRADPVRGELQKRTLVQYDFTPEQYAALAKLTAALCRVFPRLPCEVPRTTPDGPVVPHALPIPQLSKFRGILGHYHIQENKIDPGPAFDWDRFLADVRRELR